MRACAVRWTMRCRGRLPKPSSAIEAALTLRTDPILCRGRQARCLLQRRERADDSRALDDVEFRRAGSTPLVPATRLRHRSYGLRAELEHSVYDCFYLALADRDCTLVTSDERFLRKVEGTLH